MSRKIPVTPLLMGTLLKIFNLLATTTDLIMNSVLSFDTTGTATAWIRRAKVGDTCPTPVVLRSVRFSENRQFVCPFEFAECDECN